MCVSHRLSGFSLDCSDCHRLVSVLRSDPSPLTALHLINCLCSYSEDYSGYCTNDVKTIGNRGDFSDESHLLTVIPSALIGPVCKLERFRYLQLVQGSSFFFSLQVMMCRCFALFAACLVVSWKITAGRCLPPFSAPTPSWESLTSAATTWRI